ncbi:MAG: PLP-dependent aminotransferase family protein [Elainellaceae cyanobacterium]
MDLPIALDSQTSRPLHQQLYDELRLAILSGRLHPRQRLPSTRSLAQSLGISRSTVTQSYDRLLGEGYLESIQGSGTYVCAQLPDELLCSEPVKSTVESVLAPVKLSNYGKQVAQMPLKLQTEPATVINFRYGRPALNLFPMGIWRKLISRHCRVANWLDYATDFQGYLPLREAIARYLSRVRAVQCNANQIVITNGTQQALDLIMRLFIQPEETIAVEEPGYLSARRIFLSHRARLFPVPVDESGLVVEALASHDQTIRLVYVTPSHQFPTGAILSLPRRLELLAWAQHNSALILEDDYDSEYRYGDRPIPALQGLDRHHRVIYIGTFSKVLFPSLRIGYLVAPPHLVSLLAQVKWLSDRQLPLLDQLVLTDFIEQGYLESHIRRMRSYYDQNRQVLVQSLKQAFADRVTILGEQAGIHLMVRFRTRFTDAEIIERAATMQVGLMSAQPHYLHSGDRGEFILGYGELTPEQIQQGVYQLAKALK